MEEPISPIYQEVANEETSEIRRFVKTEQASSFGDELSQLQAQISHILQNVVASVSWPFFIKTRFLNNVSFFRKIRVLLDSV